MFFDRLNLEYGRMEAMKEKSSEIQGERMVLRCLREEDEAPMISLLCDEAIKKTYMIPDFDSDEQKKAFFARLRYLSLDFKRLVYGIFLQNALIGFLNEVAREDETIELGYFIDPMHWNKGYASESLRLGIEEAFRMGFARVKAAYFEGNAASKRVMEKAGMLPNGDAETVSYKGITHACPVYVIENPASES